MLHAAIIDERCAAITWLRWKGWREFQGILRRVFWVAGSRWKKLEISRCLVATGRIGIMVIFVFENK